MCMIKTASQYHAQTSYDRHKMGGHDLDWQNRPVVFKEYPGIDPVQLPVDTPAVEGKLSSILKEPKADTLSRSLGIGDLSLILRLTHTLTAKAAYSGEEFFYRSAASAGALYPTEIYVATLGIDGLDNGLYHFGIHRHALTPLRIGDLSEYIAGLMIPSPEKAPVIAFFFTAIFFRSAWKYRDRSYRYHLLDTRHILENMTVAARALRLPVHLSYDFDDRSVNPLLGVNETKEACLAMAHVPGDRSMSGSKRTEIQRLSDNIRNASIVSKKEIEYPAIKEIHRECEEVVLNRDYGHEMIDHLGLPPDRSRESLGPSSLPGETDYPDCLFARRSSRNFIREPLDKEQILALLSSLCVHDGCNCLSLGFFANNIKGITPGLYMVDTRQKVFSLVAAGSFMDNMARACLDQAWLRNASIHFLFVSNLDLLERGRGPRGYRYAMLEAGRLGERIYLVSTSLGLGCCGIGAFYDNETAKWIGLNRDSRLLYLVAVGKLKALLTRE